MDYSFSTTPDAFASTLDAAEMPPLVKAAVQAVWDATPTTDPVYEISAATGTLWTVVRVAAVRAA